MKVLLLSMPDVVPLAIHEAALHMPNHGIAALAGNLAPEHSVWLADLVRKRAAPGAYVTRLLRKLEPDVVGLTAMTWQYPTALLCARLVRRVRPQAKIVLGGYHASLMAEEIGASPDADAFDFLVRGEGEIPFRRLVDALAGTDELETIPSLSFRREGVFVHNERAELCDLATLKLPVRDGRRLTWGYHYMNRSLELLETSRGCTRNCSFCSIRSMYGRSHRTYPLERILDDLDDIYRRRRTRLVFIPDDNLVLDREWVGTLCEAIARRGYRGLRLMVQADCASVARHEDMVQAMARAGFRCLFLGIDSATAGGLQAMQKGTGVDDARKAVEICHRNGIMVIGGMVFGMPQDDDAAIRGNYEFLKTSQIDAIYCQFLNPYPKTRIREELLAEGLITNPDDFRWYNGLFANLRTRHLDAEQLQYLYWLYRQTVLGWWEPSEFVRREGRLWTAIWIYLMRPILRFFVDRKTRRLGWEGRHRLELERLRRMNLFPDLGNG